MLQYTITSWLWDCVSCLSDDKDEDYRRYCLIPWHYPPARYSELFQYPIQSFPKGEIFLWEIAENGVFYVEQPDMEIADHPQRRNGETLEEIALGFLRVDDFTIFSQLDEHGTWRPACMLSSDYVAFIADSPGALGARFKLDTYAKSLILISGNNRWRFNFGSSNKAAKIWFFSRKKNLNIYKCAKTEPLPTLQAFCGREILKMYSSKPKQIQPHTWNVALSKYQAAVASTTIGHDSWFKLTNNE